MKKEIKQDGQLKTKGLVLIISLTILCTAFSTWLVMTYVLNNPLTEISAIRQSDSTAPFIKPLLAYNTPEIQTATPLNDALKDSVKKAVNAGEITTASIYYRDLNTGRWFGINQDEKYVPASLFKVPLMIAYLKEADTNPNILYREITDDLTHDENSIETIKPLKSIAPNQTYTLDQLLHYMIEYSDNNATVLLFKNVDQTILKQVFSDLDIQLPNSNSTSDFISVHNYSFLFRVLYNATYLSHAMSEKGLEMLSKIDFADGLRKGVPKQIPVADKFGEYYILGGGNNNEHQLHDCGIIYHPKHPYILCIMTKGTSLSSLEKIMQNLSKTTYALVDNLQ
jgi:beta-lactamase class A